MSGERTIEITASVKIADRIWDELVAAVAGAGLAGAGDERHGDHK